jgi:rubrerythrin
MNPMIVMKATGAKTMPIGMTVTAPECEITGSELLSAMGKAQPGGILLANLLSAFAAHERCGVHLYRTAAGMTQFAQWEEKYEEFLAQTEEHVRILSELTTELGGDPMYVSPQARMTEFMNTKLMEPILLEGSVDGLTRELTMLEAVLLAERKCHANWHLLRQLSQQLPQGTSTHALREAVEQVEDQEDEHVAWAEQAWQQILLAQFAPGTIAG